VIGHIIFLAHDGISKKALCLTNGVYDVLDTLEFQMSKPQCQTANDKIERNMHC